MTLSEDGGGGHDDNIYDKSSLDVTPAMIEAGTERLLELLEAGAGSTYVATEVFLSMYLLLGHGGV